MEDLPIDQMYLEKITLGEEQKKARLQAEKQIAHDQRRNSDLKYLEGLALPPGYKISSSTTSQINQTLRGPKSIRNIAELESTPPNSQTYHPAPLPTPPTSPQPSRAPPPPPPQSSNQTILDLQQSLQTLQTSLHTRIATLEATVRDYDLRLADRDAASREQLQAISSGARADAAAWKKREASYTEMIEGLIAERTRLEGEIQQERVHVRELEAQIEDARWEKRRVEELMQQREKEEAEKTSNLKTRGANESTPPELSPQFNQANEAAPMVAGTKEEPRGASATGPRQRTTELSFVRGKGANVWALPRVRKTVRVRGG